MNTTGRFSPGDLVEVKAADEILRTLDFDGTLDRLPFMPEMIEYCGREFRVSKRVVKTCSSGSAGSTMRVFRGDDVVLLDGLRCSGGEHDGCQKACTIFWREAWLSKVEEADVQQWLEPMDSNRLRAGLKTSTGPRTYFCQASELLKATNQLSRLGRIGNCFTEVRAGNCNVLQMAMRIGIWLFWRIRRRCLGEYARGSRKSTPVECLNLQSDEWVEVKSMDSIVETLNESARNRGLYFTPDMRLLCGESNRVQGRIDKIIVDGTGEMRRLQNTVRLEGSLCGCAHVALGGCSRGELAYWREIWLQRPTSTVQASSGQVPNDN